MAMAMLGEPPTLSTTSIIAMPAMQETGDHPGRDGVQVPEIAFGCAERKWVHGNLGTEPLAGHGL